MTDRSNALLKQALKLSSREKVQFIEGLLASLDNPDASIDNIWAEESDARIEAFEKGQVSAKSVETVLGKYTRP
ncbi:addiction module protein [Marinomonas sp. GJ51-6]|uniref:addiction module protein n=1 Tax=unclassified Marinomonas TaxID=196814 RepID=UPI002934242A|nr:addiction module protein [Marinomonas sp. GJ51-6]WOD08027.1 addiction module protein [Marinomonas sp. GJ51-6]